MKLLINFFLYSGTEVLNKAIPFLLLPIITKYLTPQEYGMYGMYQVLLSFLVPFITMNSQVNITRNFFKISKEELGQIVSSLLLILHLHVFLALVVIYLYSFFYENLFGLSTATLTIMPIIIYLQTINTFNLTILRNEEKALPYGLTQIAITLINYSVAILLLLFLNKGWMSLVYGTLIAHLLLAFYSLYSLKSMFGFKKQLYSFKRIYQISLPLVFHLLGGSIIAMSDRVFIENMLGASSVGLYMIGTQFGMMVSIAINTVMLTLNPWIYKNLANNNQKVVPKLYLLMGGFAVLGMAIWSLSLIIFPYMVDKEYLLGKEVIIWVVVTFIIRGWYQIFFNVLVHEGKTGFFMYITAIGGVVNIVLNYFLINENGIVGASQATLISYIIIFGLTFYNASRYSSLKWGLFR